MKERLLGCIRNLHFILSPRESNENFLARAKENCICILAYTHEHASHSCSQVMIRKTEIF